MNQQVHIYVHSNLSHSRAVKIRNSTVKASLLIGVIARQGSAIYGKWRWPVHPSSWREISNVWLWGILGSWYWSSVLLSSRSRFLRNRDRDVHYHMYPKLFYPELYLIEGGYKAFFGKCKVRDIVDVKKVLELNKLCGSARIWVSVGFPCELQNFLYFLINRPFSNSRCWTGTSLQVRLMPGDDILHVPPFQASSSPIPRVPIWSSCMQVLRSVSRHYRRWCILSWTFVFFFPGILWTPVLSADVGRKSLARPEAIF